MSQHLDKPLAVRPQARGPLSSIGLRLGVALLLVLAVGGILSQINLRRNLARLRTSMLSGVAEGNYHRVVSELAVIAAKDSGKLINIPSEGSGDNVTRLRAARKSCEVAFGLVQDGSDFGATGDLQLIGRLAKSESVFFLGKDADAQTDLRRLSHLKIGVGPERSGSARVAKEFFALPDLSGLGVELVYLAPSDELTAVREGRLDLMMLVIDEDAPFVADAVRSGLQIAELAHLDVLARKLPYARVGQIGAGQYDPIRGLPAQDKHVLRIDTLVVGNGCASRSATVAMMTALTRRFPDFVRHNKQTTNTSGLELAPAAANYFDHEGPELADDYVPWLVDVMPPANWGYVIMAVSLLFNIMGFGHRFRLWRIDARRVKLESELGNLFGPTATLSDIARTHAADEMDDARRERLEHLVKELETLAAKSRKQSLSMLVPMGQEMAYRYQEGVIHETLGVLRGVLRHAVTPAVTPTVDPAVTP